MKVCLSSFSSDGIIFGGLILFDILNKSKIIKNVFPFYLGIAYVESNYDQISHLRKGFLRQLNSSANSGILLMGTVARN